MIEVTIITPDWPHEHRRGVCLKKPGAGFEIHIMPNRYVMSTRIYLVTEPGRYDNWIHDDQLREILATWFATEETKEISNV